MKTILTLLLTAVCATAANWTNYPTIATPAGSDTLLIGTTSTNRQWAISNLLTMTETNATRAARTIIITTSNSLVTIITTSTNGLASTNYVNSTVTTASNVLSAQIASASNTVATASANASNLTSGTVPNARLTGTIQTNGAFVDVTSLVFTNQGGRLILTGATASASMLGFEFTNNSARIVSATGTNTMTATNLTINAGAASRLQVGTALLGVNSGNPAIFEPVNSFFFSQRAQAARSGFTIQTESDSWFSGKQVWLNSARHSSGDWIEVNNGTATFLSTNSTARSLAVSNLFAFGSVQMFGTNTGPVVPVGVAMAGSLSVDGTNVIVVLRNAFGALTTHTVTLAPYP